MGVLMIGALLILFGIHVGAPDFWKLPSSFMGKPWEMYANRPADGGSGSSAGVMHCFYASRRTAWESPSNSAGACRAF